MTWSVTGGREDDESPIIKDVKLAIERFPLRHPVKVLSNVYATLVHRRPVRERQLFLLDVNSRFSQELETACMVVVQVRLYRMSDSFGLNVETMKARDHVITWFHHNVIQIGGGTQTAPRISDEARVGTAVE